VARAAPEQDLASRIGAANEAGDATGTLRRRLDAAGLTPTFTLSGPALGNIRGGLATRGVTNTLAGFGIEGDLEHTLGWAGASFAADIQWIRGKLAP
jgi:carbohydrate-selective porin OprB